MPYQGAHKGRPYDGLRAGGDDVNLTVMEESSFHNPPDTVIYEILSRPCRIAVVGCSPDPVRDSYHVTQLLIEKGHTVFPVNPSAQTILGRSCYSALSDVPTPVDMVDIFRRSESVGPIVEEAIVIGARIVWMQRGVINPAAAARAQQAGLMVIMDRCPAVEYKRLF